MSNGPKGAYDRMGNYYEFTSQKDMHERMDKQHVVHSGQPPAPVMANPLSDPDDDLPELPVPPARSLSDDDLALLKQAALAIGCVLFEEVEGEEYVNLHFADGSATWSWNPLAFSGDAFDLAATLELDVMHRVVSGKRVEVLPAGGPLVKHFYEGNVIVATRRAIVLSAAEVAKSGRRMSAQQ